MNQQLGVASPSSALATPAVAKGKPVELELTPEKDIVVLDVDVSGATFVVNMVTLERHKLPHAEWALIFDDDDGDGVLADTGPHEHAPIVVSDLMGKTVYTGAMGRFWTRFQRNGK